MRSGLILLVLATFGGRAASAALVLSNGTQCGGTAYCSPVKGAPANVLCRTSQAPWTDAACPAGAACIRPPNSTTVWRCLPAPKTTVTPPQPADWSRVVTDRHNAYRARHHAPALAWNATVAAAAARWAANCAFRHSQTLYGENLFMSSSAALSKQQAALQATDLWYAEAARYDYAAPGFSGATGHFTAVVWVATRALGCGVQACPGMGTVVVCNYWPPGNVWGAFERNVLPPR